MKRIIAGFILLSFAYPSFADSSGWIVQHPTSIEPISQDTSKASSPTKTFKPIKSDGSSTEKSPINGGKPISISVSINQISTIKTPSKHPIKDSKPTTQVKETVVNKAAEPQAIMLDAGTRIPITIYSAVNSNSMKTGDMIPVSVNEPVKVNGIVIFKKGSTGTLSISKSVKSGGHGRAGQLEISSGRIQDVFGNYHPVGISISSVGESKRAIAVLLSVLGVSAILIPFGIWINGTPATIQGGQYFDALTTTSDEITLPALTQAEAK